MGHCNCKEAESPVAEESPEETEVIPTAKFETPQEIVVTIVSARGLHGPDWFPGTDRFVLCTLKYEGDDEELHRTTPVKDTLEPFWNEEVSVPFKDNRDLELCIYEVDANEKGEAVGKALVESAKIATNGFNGELQLQQKGTPTETHLKVKVKMLGKGYPDGPLEEFHAYVENPYQRALGLDVDVQDGYCLYITDVHEGPVQSYNEATEPAKQVLKGDFIMKVNGRKGTTTILLEALKASGTLDLVIRRPLEFTVAVNANGPSAPRGVTLKKGCANSIVITEIQDGPVKAWNEAYPEQQVRVGDRIVAVNGERCRPGELLNKFKASKCHITVTRPCVPEKPLPVTPR